MGSEHKLKWNSKARAERFIARRYSRITIWELEFDVKTRGKLIPYLCKNGNHWHIGHSPLSLSQKDKS